MKRARGCASRRAMKRRAGPRGACCWRERVTGADCGPPSKRQYSARPSQRALFSASAACRQPADTGADQERSAARGCWSRPLSCRHSQRKWIAARPGLEGHGSCAEVGVPLDATVFVGAGELMKKSARRHADGDADAGALVGAVDEAAAAGSALVASRRPPGEEMSTPGTW